MTVVAKISPVEIATRRAIENGKSLFQPFTSTVLPRAKVTSILSSISLPRKQ